MTSIGIVGFGSFGELVARTLQGTVDVKVSSRTMSKVPEQLQATLEEVCRCDYLVLSIPLASYRTVLAEITKHIDPQTIVVDVCSVKVKPVEIIRELLPDNRLVATHPLFGPQTTENGLAGHVMVLCDDVSDKEATQAVADWSQSVGLEVKHMTTAEHDQQMAKVHALTFFIARALFGTDFSDVTLKTPSFERLLNLIELEHNHSRELFETIQLGNPFAEETRQQFIRHAQALAQDIVASDTVY